MPETPRDPPPVPEPGPPPVPEPSEPPVLPDALGLPEIRGVLLRPDRALELVLGRPDRIASTVGGGDHLWALSLLLLLLKLILFYS